MLCDGEFDEQLLQRLCAEALGHYSVISIAFNYPDVEAMLSHAERIEHYKALSEDRINFLRPAAADDGRMVVPDDKIVDNSICDSVRVKYRPANLDRNPVALPFGAAEFFRRASELFGEHRLYHRSPSDGYFAIRAEDGNDFYITATKTYKDDLDLRRVAFAEHYDERTNTLHYRGSYLPSSDFVEAAVLLSRRPPHQDHRAHPRQHPLHPESAVPPTGSGRRRVLGGAPARRVAGQGAGAGGRWFRDHGGAR